MTHDILEAAVRALRESVGMSQYGRAEVILATVTPLILERAAKVADGWTGPAAKAIATDIRALKEQP